MNLLFLLPAVLLSILTHQLFVNADEEEKTMEMEKTELRMPGVKPDKADTYLCRSLELDNDFDHYLVGFEPHGSAKTAHHMLLFGCKEPGSDKPLWNCNEMEKGEGSSPCGSGGTQIIYAWALDAPKLQLPDGVGFKVGGDSSIRHLVLQVHYMHPMAESDESGMTLLSTKTPMPKSAATLLMVTGGGMAAKSTDKFETACIIDEDVVMHPFAFRTHTHKHGKSVSGWKISKGDDGQEKWELIGKRDPQQPQMFYPVEDPKLQVTQGDVLAARCTMDNQEERDVLIGATGADEMCNFYMMYWVDGDRVLSDNTCLSPGPPNYYWNRDAGLEHVPDNA